MKRKIDPAVENYRVSMAPIIANFKVEVRDKAQEVDPDHSEDWYSLTIGWAIAKGLRPEDAREFASFIRYQTDLG